MSRKDYRKIADILRAFGEIDNREHYDDNQEWLIGEFSDFLAKDNPRFNRDKFREACQRKES